MLFSAQGSTVRIFSFLAGRPEGVGGMSVQELRELVIRIEEDIDDLFYYGGDIKNVSLRQFEEAWREGGEEDAHGA